MLVLIWFCFGGILGIFGSLGLGDGVIGGGRLVETLLHNPESSASYLTGNFHGLKIPGDTIYVSNIFVISCCPLDIF